MKKFILIALITLFAALSLTACKTQEDVKPKNETTTPNCVYFV